MKHWSLYTYLWSLTLLIIFSSFLTMSLTSVCLSSIIHHTFPISLNFIHGVVTFKGRWFTQIKCLVSKLANAVNLGFCFWPSPTPPGQVTKYAGLSILGVTANMHILNEIFALYLSSIKRSRLNLPGRAFAEENAAWGHSAVRRQTQISHTWYDKTNHRRTPVMHNWFACKSSKSSRRFQLT